MREVTIQEDRALRHPRAALTLIGAMCVLGCNVGGPNRSTPDGNGGDGGDGSMPDTQKPRVVLRAGSLGGCGNIDGTGTEARFCGPQGVAIDSAGNVLVADMYNHVIRKVDAAGVVTVFAGHMGVQGSDDGPNGHLSYPKSLALNGSGTLFVAELTGRIRTITPAAAISTYGQSKSFIVPSSATIAVDASGSVFTFDEGKHVILRMSPDGVVTTVAGSSGQSGSADGQGAAARFDQPAGITIDGAGNLFVSDSQNRTIRKITPTGMVSTIAGAVGMLGQVDGDRATGRLYYPGQLAIDATGSVWVADAFYTLRKVTPAGTITTVMKPGPGLVYGPDALAVHADGRVVMAEGDSSVIHSVSSDGIRTTLAGPLAFNMRADGTGSQAHFFYTNDLAVDSAGNVFVADSDIIRKVTAAGVVTTLLDSNQKQLLFKSVAGLATDSAGNLLIAEFGNNAIRKIAPDGNLATVVAPGKIVHPRRIAVDASGNMVVTSDQTVQKVTPAGVVTTLAGSAIQSGNIDAKGSAARFSSPDGVAVDSGGNVFVADYGNQTIRKITADGEVTTLAGAPAAANAPRISVDGVGTAARFARPTSLALGPQGDLFVGDGELVRRVTADGTVTTVAGVVGQQGVRLGPLPTSLNYVGATAALPNGDLVIASERSILDVILTPPPRP